MGSMTDEEHTRILLQLLRYVPYLKEEKVNIQRFVSGLSVPFKYNIKFDEPISLEEAIKKLNHCYKQSKRNTESNQDWKGNEKNKGKWVRKRGKL